MHPRIDLEIPGLRRREPQFDPAVRTNRRTLGEAAAILDGQPDEPFRRGAAAYFASFIFHGAQPFVSSINASVQDCFAIHRYVKPESGEQINLLPRALALRFPLNL